VSSRSKAGLSRRQVLGTGLGLVAGALLAACGQAAAPPASTPAPSEPAKAAGAAPTNTPAAAAAAKPAEATAAKPAEATPTVAAAAQASGKAAVTIAYWRPVKGKGEEEGTSSITESFSKANPNVTFKVEYIPEETLPQKYQSGLATNSVSDILTLDTEWPAVYAGVGALADPPPDLQSFIKNNAFGIVQEVATHKGKFVAVPIDSSNLVLGYNVKLVKDAGLDPEKAPADWAEFADLAARVTKRDGSGKLQQAGFTTPWAGEWDWDTWLAAAGGRRWLSLEGVAYLEPPFVAAAQLFPELIFNKKVDDVAGIEDAFTHGKAAITTAGPWTVTGMKKDAPDLEWKSWLIPPMKAGGTSGTTLGGWHLGVYTKSKVADPTWQFIQHHLKNENRVLWYKLTARTPAWKDVADDPIFKSDPNRITMVKQMATNVAAGLPSSPGYLDVRDNVTVVLERIMKNKEDVKKVLTEEKAKIDPIFAQKSKG
jgi:ABC-type glycerol-3-phosphate transport system substrate-binding protein